MGNSIVKVISERTAISLYLVIFLIGGVVWATTIHAKVDSIESKQTQDDDFKKEVIDRLARIETRQEIFIKANKGK